MLARAERLLPAEHGQITVRGDNGFYSVELMSDCRKRKMRFTFSATRTSVMWQSSPRSPKTRGRRDRHGRRAGRRAAVHPGGLEA